MQMVCVLHRVALGSDSLKLQVNAQLDMAGVGVACPSGPVVTVGNSPTSNCLEVLDTLALVPSANASRSRALSARRQTMLAAKGNTCSSPGH